MADLFSHQRDATLARLAPLAERMRPRTLDDFVGQEAILGPGRLLRRAISADRVGNLILHGPPGTGKTTLARIIAGHTRASFSSLNAVLAGVKDLRAEVEQARERLAHHGLRTILFIDEVHRFNSAQQDALLPWVENGTVTLIGATTENPFFEVNKALVSRSRLFRLQPLEPDDLRRLLRRALADRDHGYGEKRVRVTPEAEAHWLDVANGDARSLLNALELAVETTEPDAEGTIAIDLAIAEESIQQRAVLYDKQGDAHFDTISAFIKSLRGSDPDAALFWLARMVEAGEDPRFLFRRMLIAAGEDVGLADPLAVVVVEACAASFERVGLPEGLYPLAQAALYLASTDKSNSTLGLFDALKTVRQAQKQQVPAHLRDAHRDGPAFGDGQGYRYPHAYAEHWVAQQYLPTTLRGQVFWQPGALGWEGERRAAMRQRRAAQLAAVAEQGDDLRDALSAGPDDPQLQRWLARQAAAEGERLDLLRQRFWGDHHPRRLDRVLVLQARSLLWALDPLHHAAEGDVVLTVANAEEREALEAQLQVLDPLVQPRLVLTPDDDPRPLRALAQPGGRFEWIVARQPRLEHTVAGTPAWAEVLSELAAPGAHLRLLFSQPRLGPATALRSLLTTPGGAATAEASLLDRVVAAEARELQSHAVPPATLVAELGRRGWRLAERSWEEALDLPLAERLLVRWFADAAPYRASLLAAGMAPAELTTLRRWFQSHLGARLPQRLGHGVLEGRWPLEPAPTPPKKSPGQRRGQDT
ncbi:MAG: AAA family ATPase [Cyanobacteriota bacterium]|nr:AAA family ATPase [Cyanobacteriota bacterium]